MDAASPSAVASPIEQPATKALRGIVSGRYWVQVIQICFGLPPLPLF